MLNIPNRENVQRFINQFSIGFMTIKVKVIPKWLLSYLYISVIEQGVLISIYID